MRAEFCIFKSNAPGLKANFYEPYVDKPSDDRLLTKINSWRTAWRSLLTKFFADENFLLYSTWAAFSVQEKVRAPLILDLCNVLKSNYYLYHRICLTINKIVYYQHLLVLFEELLSLWLSDYFALVVGCINNNWLNLWKKDVCKVFTGISPPLWAVDLLCCQECLDGYLLSSACSCNRHADSCYSFISNLTANQTRDADFHGSPRGILTATCFFTPSNVTNPWRISPQLPCPINWRRSTRSSVMIWYSFSGQVAILPGRVIARSTFLGASNSAAGIILPCKIVQKRRVFLTRARACGWIPLLKSSLCVCWVVGGRLYMSHSTREKVIDFERKLQEKSSH